MSTQEKPLVTFGLIAYKQEKFIREAVAGAFAQTYSPLQIILSDDCSTDKTFEIMQEMASQYHGPHQIVLNRNESNLGIGGHINQVMSLAEGELIVIAAGDDISLPKRTAVLVDKWMTLGRGALSVHTSVLQIDEAGHELGIRRPAIKIDGFVPGGIIGASHGWSKELFRIFGELRADVTSEDHAIGFRALLADGVYFIDQPLVKYRVGGISDSFYTQKDDCELQRWRRWIVLTRQQLADLNKLSISPPLIKEKLERRLKDYELLQELACSRRPFVSLFLNRKSITIFSIKYALKYLFPRVFMFFRLFRRILK